VTYAYGDDDEYDEVVGRADAYCAEQYNKNAELVESHPDGSDFEATFACK